MGNNNNNNKNSIDKSTTNTKTHHSQTKMDKEGSRTSSPDQKRVKSDDSAASTVQGRTTPQINSLKLVGRTRWLALKTINWTDDEGKQRQWDVATRTTKKKDTPDAVVIIPILRSKKNNSIDTVLVEQYRPPVGSYALEFPAGLIDKNETAQQAALRELWEETGYTGTVDTSFPEDELCMTPGLADETIKIIVVNVDLDDPKNVNPKQNQDEGESIIVRRVPLTTGLKTVLGDSKAMPISLLYSFAIGLEMGVKMAAEMSAKTDS